MAANRQTLVDRIRMKTGMGPVAQTGDVSLDSLFGGSSLGDQATQGAHPIPVAKPAPQADDAAYEMEQWNRVDKARAVKGLPSLPKPGSKAARQ